MGIWGGRGGGGGGGGGGRRSQLTLGMSKVSCISKATPPNSQLSSKVKIGIITYYLSRLNLKT